MAKPSKAKSSATADPVLNPKILYDMDACQPARDWFRLTFSDRDYCAPISQVALALIGHIKRNDWLLWLMGRSGEMARALFNLGVEGNTYALRVAMHRLNFESMVLLLQSGVVPDREIFQKIVEQGRVNNARKMLNLVLPYKKNVADLDLALKLAIRSGWAGIVCLLLENGARISVIDSDVLVRYFWTSDRNTKYRMKKLFKEYGWKAQ